jgi:hypothetical protein
MLWPLHQCWDHRHVEGHQCAYTGGEVKVNHPLQGISDALLEHVGREKRCTAAVSNSRPKLLIPIRP